MTCCYGSSALVSASAWPAETELHRVPSGTYEAAKDPWYVHRLPSCVVARQVSHSAKPKGCKVCSVPATECCKLIFIAQLMGCHLSFTINSLALHATLHCHPRIDHLREDQADMVTDSTHLLLKQPRFVCLHSLPQSHVRI